jgi:hypothetical protein
MLFQSQTPGCCPQFSSTGQGTRISTDFHARRTDQWHLNPPVPATQAVVRAGVPVLQHRRWSVVKAHRWYCCLQVFATHPAPVVVLPVPGPATHRFVHRCLPACTPSPVARQPSARPLRPRLRRCRAGCGPDAAPPWCPIRRVPWQTGGKPALAVTEFEQQAQVQCLFVQALLQDQTGCRCQTGKYGQKDLSALVEYAALTAILMSVADVCMLRA